MQEIFDTIKSINTNDISEETLFSLVEETFNEVMSGDITKESISELLSTLRESNQTLSVSSEKEQKKIFNETIQSYTNCIDKDDTLLKKHLYMLTHNDKILHTVENSYFYLLKQVLDSILLHKNAVDMYLDSENSDSMIQRGISSSKSTVIKDIIMKRKNSLEETLELLPHDKSAQNSLKIINEFLENPRTTNIAINQTIALFSSNDIPGLSADEYETVKLIGQYLDSDRPIKKVEVFYESLAASIVLFYNKESYFLKIMRLNTISNKTLSEIITVIIRSTFNPEYSIDELKIAHPIQQRCMYGNKLPLLEFQTPKDIKLHPSFGDDEVAVDLQSDISTILRGKLPPKSSS